MPIVYDNWRKMSQIINSNSLVAAFDCSFANVIFFVLGESFEENSIYYADFLNKCHNYYKKPYRLHHRISL